MTEIMCHPWVTYESFPKYIDYKLVKIQSRSSKNVKESVNMIILKDVIEKGFQFDKLMQEEDYVKMVLGSENHSFVVAYNLMLFNEKKLRHIQRNSLKKKKGEYVFTFSLVKEIFANNECGEQFKKNFRNYTVDLFSNFERKPWRIGFNFCTNLKKIVKTFLTAANLENIKVEVASPADYKFRCFLMSSFMQKSDHSFIMQIFDNSDEYVLDLVNDGLSNLRFVLICFKLFRRMKVYFFV